LFTVAHAVQWALAHYREATLAFLVSLIVGALRAPVVQTGIELTEAGRGWTPESIGLFVAVAAVGAAVVVGIDRLAGGVGVGSQS
jgi:putative membrane protein